jgi:hypothetical protein
VNRCRYAVGVSVNRIRCAVGGSARSEKASRSALDLSLCSYRNTETPRRRLWTAGILFPSSHAALRSTYPPPIRRKAVHKKHRSPKPPAEEPATPHRIFLSALTETPHHRAAGSGLLGFFFPALTRRFDPPIRHLSQEKRCIRSTAVQSLRRKTQSPRTKSFSLLLPKHRTTAPQALDCWDSFSQLSRGASIHLSATYPKKSGA